MVLMLPPVDDVSRMEALLNLIPEDSRPEAAEMAWETHNSGTDPYQAVESFAKNDPPPDAAPEAEEQNKSEAPRRKSRRTKQSGV